MFYVIAKFNRGVLCDIDDDPKCSGLLCTENKNDALRVKALLEDNPRIYDGSEPTFEVIEYEDMNMPRDVFCPEGLINVEGYTSEMVYYKYLNDRFFSKSMVEVYRMFNVRGE